MALLCPFGTALTASAYTVEVTTQGENGAYWGTSPEGFEIGFAVNGNQYWDEPTQEYKYTYEVYLSNLKVNDGTVTLPEAVTFSTSISDTELAGKTFPITRLGNSDYGVNWYESENFSLVVPECYTGIGNLNKWIPTDNQGNGYDVYPKTITFEGLTPPSFNSNKSSSTLILVKPEALTTYLAKCKEGSDGWNSEIGVFEIGYRDKKTEIENDKVGWLEYHLMTMTDNELRKIYNLVIAGPINVRDMNVFSKLKNLVSLDLSYATIAPSDDVVMVRGCANLSWLEEVKLPESVTKINDQAFSNCRRLRTIDLSNITEIGSNAFEYCSSLASVDAPELLSVPRCAFQYCSSLTTFNAPKVERFATWSLAYTAIKEFSILPGVYYSNDFLFDSKVEKLYLYTNRSLNNFSNMDYLTDVYLYDPIPASIERDETQPKIENLHVPGFAYGSFINNSNYLCFNNILPIVTNLESLDVYAPLTISNNESLAEKFDLNITSNLQNDYTGDLYVGNFTQSGRYVPSEWSSETSDGPTFITKGNITADNIAVTQSLRNNNWSFISLPYDVDLSSVITPKEALWVVREYSSETRANRVDNTTSSWVNLSGTMTGRKGYILHFSSNNGDDFTFPAIAGGNGNNLLTKDNVSIDLEYWASVYAHNESWNLIGNPYDAYFDTRLITFDNPITVWNYSERTYEAFSLVDDDYVLSPFEAFFVQAPRDHSSILFHYGGCSHTKEIASQNRAPRRVASNPDRAIINVRISGNGTSDRTRLVINEEASTAYELSCDAAKFLSLDEEVAQIYMLQDDQRLAINERPLGNAEFALGTRFGIDGAYSISVDTRNADYSVILRDNLTGTETDLTEAEEYTFAAGAGSDDSRFTLRLKAGASAVESIAEKGAFVSVEGNTLNAVAKGEINVFSIDGKVVASANDNLTTNLPAGIYVVKSATKAVKVVVGK